MDNKASFEYYSSVEQRNVKWLWYPYIPYGKITLLQGDPGDGKSTFMINVAAALTCGNQLPDGTVIKKPETVIYQCAEDNVQDTIKPRLIQAGADCSKVAYINDENMDLSLIDQRIEDVIRDVGAKLLIFDPLQAFIPADSDMYSASRMRTIMRKLGDTAKKYDCAVVLIGHMTKAAGGKKLYRGLGSIDIAAIARSVLMLARDEQNPEIRYMYPVKSSLAPEGEAISFLLDQELGFQWIGKCKIPKGEMVCTGSSRLSKKEKAKELLKIILSAGELPSADIMKRMGNLGIKERTVRTAQKELGIQAHKRKGRWYWEYTAELCEESDVGEE